MGLKTFFRSLFGWEDDKSQQKPDNRPLYKTVQVDITSERINRKTQEEAPSEEKKTLKKESFSVAGVYYHKDAIGNLASANPDWRKAGKTLAAEGKVMEQIPRYTYTNKPVKLVPEPMNQNDPHAIKVVIAGEHVGYISRDDAVHVGEILARHEVKYLYSRFRGGDYKIVSEDGSAMKTENDINIALYIGYI